MTVIISVQLQEMHVSYSDNPSPTSLPPAAVPVPLTWPPDGQLSLDWIQYMILAFDWSSKNMSPSSFPSVFLVPVSMPSFLQLLRSSTKNPITSESRPPTPIQWLWWLAIFMGNCMIFSSTYEMLDFLSKMRSLSSMETILTEELGVLRLSKFWPSMGIKHYRHPSKRMKGKKNRRINLVPEANTLCLGSLEELSKARRSVLDPH
ncbi:hypothetical protein F3Y22_tig00110050pilonHSYRG00029 [Hibiscus syriacus]|uniref:Uncharacterized protein n=1 Tax=Hibiscus syriacus TaxID=106335 RepID=A0A6A3BJY8_HIBSY|nr:hypothetical protein F3Y22_tig00110050pilonHSYRG00029 [Hibiscus syriacus]